MAVKIFTKNASSKGDELKDTAFQTYDGTNTKTFRVDITNIQTAPLSGAGFEFVNAVYRYKCDVKVTVNNPDPGVIDVIKNITGDFILWNNDGRRWQFLSDEFFFVKIGTFRIRSNYILLYADNPNFNKITEDIVFHAILQKHEAVTWQDVSTPNTFHTKPKELYTQLLGQKIWVNDSWHTLTTNDKIYDGTTWRNIN